MNRSHLHHLLEETTINWWVETTRVAPIPESIRHGFEELATRLEAAVQQHVHELVDEEVLDYKDHLNASSEEQTASDEADAQS